MMEPPDRLKIAHIITKLAVGGAQESVVVTCTGLPVAQFEQVILSGVEVDAEGALWDDPRLQGVQLVRVPQLVRALRPISDLRAVVSLVRALRGLRPDIVHTHSSKAGILGRAAARLSGVRTVVHSVHGWSFNDDMHPAVRRGFIVAERLAARFTHALIVESSTDLPKGLKERIGTARQYSLVRNGIPLAEFQAVDRATARAEVLPSLGVPVDAWVVGTVGRLADQKDPLMMVDAFARLRAEVADAEFLWVGGGPLRAATEARAAELGVADSFHLLGVRRDVARVLASLDAFALSSRWEGLPRTITEAMAVGLPVVATRVDGTAEVIVHGRTGLLVESGDAKALAAGLRAIWHSDRLRSELSGAARERAQMFSSDVMHEDLASIYRAVARRQPPPPSHRPRKVLHVISGLGHGGAERQLSMLIRASDPARVVHEVISLSDHGTWGPELAAHGVPVQAINMRRGPRLALDVLHLRRLMSRAGADLVQTWLYHGDLVGGLVARSLRLPVVWNVRMSWMDPTTTKRATMMSARLCARLSRWVPARTVFNSTEGIDSHVDHGYSVSTAVLIENAVDTALFRPDDTAKARLAEMLGVPAASRIIGQVARYDPQKGHVVMLDAMRTVVDKLPEAHLVLVGTRCDHDNEELVRLIRERGLEDRVHLLGPRSDVPQLTAGFDVAVSASTYGESSSNAVAEAVACGVPVVSTDVGSVLSLVAGAGRVVQPGSEDELARAVIETLLRDDVGRAAAKTAAQRIALERDVAALTDRYTRLWDEVVRA